MQTYLKYLLPFLLLIAAGGLSACGQSAPDISAQDKPAKKAGAIHTEDHDEDHDAHGDEDEHGEDEHGHKEDADHTDDHSPGETAGHAGEDDLDHEAEQVVRLSSAEMKEFGIEVTEVTPGRIDRTIDLPGEIVLNADRLVHVVPRVAGIASQVNKSLGNQVNAGEVLAVLESRELADAKAEYLSARERFQMSQADFKREQGLWKKKITAEKEFLQARQMLGEHRIALRAAEQKLHALGFSDDYLKELSGHHDMTYTRYEIRAPFGGTIIKKHIALGEIITTESPSFTIADLSTVWVDIDIYQKDLATIRKGQSVTITAGHGVADVTGRIAWVGPLVGEATRTAKARVILTNPDGSLRPGMFITARVAASSESVAVRVPKTSLQTLENRQVVFVQTGEGFEPRHVQTGHENATHVEILAGLRQGQTIVSRGAFTLKAQLSKGAFDDGHNH